MKSPFIIIGMHRSGTSMVAQVLDSAGIFMGVLKDHNHEAMHFLSCNQRSLWANGNNWLEPDVPFKENWKTLPAKSLFAEHFKLNTRIQRLLCFLRAPSWGWKDPRNTFTLPMWLTVYPRAKVIYVKRNPADIAKSLQQRNQRPGEVHDPRLADPDFCLNLVNTYQKQAESYASNLNKRFIEVEYEALISFDASTIKRLERFTGKKLSKHFNTYVR